MEDSGTKLDLAEEMWSSKRKCELFRDSEIYGNFKSYTL